MGYRNEQGQFHREDGPAFEYANGTKAWWLNGKCHREDGPAVIWANGDKHWLLHHKRHRLDGPAIMRLDGTNEWWVNGVQVDEFTVWVLGGSKETS